MSDIPPKPEIKIFPEGIPEDIKNIKRWLNWKYVFDPDKNTYNKKPSIEWSKPEKLMTFDEVFREHENDKNLGIGFVFSKEDNIIGIDIDRCFTVANDVTKSITEIIGKLNCYCEITPSGWGLHIIGRVKNKTHWTSEVNIKHDGCDHIEFYPYGRFFTFTGNSHKKLPRAIEFINEDELQKIVKKSLEGKKEPLFLPAEIDSGERNGILFKFACKMRNSGASRAAILAAISEENRLRCRPPLPDRELEIIANQAGKYLPTNPVKINAKIEASDHVKMGFEERLLNVSVLPDNHLFKMYVEYGTRVQDTYPEFHLINIMTLLSCLVPAKSDPAFGEVWNNLWIVALAIAGDSGKSTSLVPLDEATRNISTLRPGSIAKMPQLPTPQSFVDLLAENKTRLWIIDEFQRLFKFFKHEYASELYENILLAYSHMTLSRSRVAKKNKSGEVVEGGTTVVENPHVSILGYTTPDAFFNNIKPEMFESGLLQRPMYVIALREKEIKKDRERDKRDIEMLENVKNRLVELYDLTKGKTIIFNESEILNDWKLDERKKLRHLKNDIRRGARTRNFEHSRKLAIMLTLGSEEFLNVLRSRVDSIPVHNQNINSAYLFLRERIQLSSTEYIPKNLLLNEYSKYCVEKKIQPMENREFWHQLEALYPVIETYHIEDRQREVVFKGITFVKEYQQPLDSQIIADRVIPATLNFNIPEWAARAAIDWVNIFSGNFDEIYRLSIMRNDGPIGKIKKALTEVEWVSKTDLQIVVRRYGRQFDDLMADLIGEGIVITDQKKAHNGKIATCYKLGEVTG